MPIFNGTIDSDLLDGTFDADTIIGFAGNDTIFGREGNDLLNGNQGDDTVKGGDGNDWVRGGQDNDQLFGDAGNDTLHGDRGNDTAFGGDGDDQLFGDTGVEANFTGNGNDILYGGLGNDSLFGLAGNDQLLGSDGKDFFCGNKGNDTVFGEDGNDLIRGGQDNDLLFGGAGNDVIFGDLGTDTVTGGEGKDTFVIGRRFDVPGFRTTGGLTTADADWIADFIKGQDLIELIGGLTFEELNIFNGSGTNIGNTIIQDKFTGDYLAILQGIDASNISGINFIPPGITPPPVGTLQFSATNFSINEDGTPVVALTITRTDGSSGAIGVQVILNGGSAFGGSSPLAAPKDYDNSFITVNWADGDTSPKTVTVALFNDTEIEGNETVNLTLDFPTGGATIGTQNTAVLTIVDNDTQPIPGTLSFNSANYSDNEGNSGTPNKIVGTIQRTGGSNGTVTVQVQLGEGSTATPNDFTNNLPITVTFNPGETSKNVELPILGDTIPERDDTINLRLVNPTGGATLGTQQTATYTIVNDDIATDPEIEVLDKTTNIADGTATAINFGTTTVNSPVIKTFTVKNIGNAALSLSGLNLPDGFSLVGNFPSSIAAASDATFQVQLNANATGTFNGTLQFTNNDSDENPLNFPIAGTVEPPPTVSITATDAEAAETGKNTGTFRITRTGSSGGALTVNLDIDASSTVTSNAGGAFGVDYDFSVSGGGSISGTGANRTLIIPAGQSFVDLIVTPANDEHAEADETLKLNLAAGSYTIDGANNNATVTIIANDTVVINTNDSVDNYALREGSLRQAILNAISFAGADTISFAGAGASGTINLTAALPEIIGNNANNTTINGSGANTLTVRRDTGGNYGIFRVHNGVNATFSNLTIANGRGFEGSGIFNLGGTVSVTNSNLSGNITDSQGGGIRNESGTVSVTNSNLSDNMAQGGSSIFNRGGTVSVTNTTISTNNTQDFRGSSITNSGGTVSVTNSTITGNPASFNRGINNVYGRVDIINSTISDHRLEFDPNNPLSRWGGGVANGEIANITNSTISGNSATEGGGVFNAGTLNITNSTISGNRVEFDPRNFIPGTSGGGVFNAGAVNITNSTISGNLVEFDPRNFNSGRGGGVFNGNTAIITNSTIAGNSATEGSGVFNAGAVNAKNTIIAGNTAPTNPDFYGTLNSLGYNLIGDTTGTTFTGDTTGNILNVAANLGALQNNGGSTQTMALLANSPAINAGDPNFTPPPNTDQRGTGFDRIQGGRLDIGAFESNLLPLTTVSITATDEAAAEVDNNTGTFRITRTGNTAGDLTVNLAIDANSTVTSNAGGAFGVDYDFSVSGGGSISGTGANRTLIIPAGQSFVDLIVTPANDEHAEADETLKLNLAAGSYTIDGANNNATVTIIANDTVVINTNDIYEKFTFEGGSVKFTPLTASEYMQREGSLRQAMLNAIANPGADTVSFTDGGASGTIDIAAPLPFLNGANANNTTIDGPGANILTVQRGDTTRTYGIFMVGSGVTATISGLTITKGDWTQGGLISGGGIYNDGGIVNVINSTISGNTGSTYFINLGGGGIYNKDGTMNVTNSTISDNKAGNFGGQGGGIYNENGTVNVTNSNISGNVGDGTSGGGGIYNDGGTVNVTNSNISNNRTQGGVGGGIGNNGGSVNVTSSTLSNNTSSFFGGGIGNNAKGQVQIVNSTISTNTGSGGGGGIFNTGNSTVNLNNSTISSNKADKAGGINNAAGTVIAKDTIIAGNTVTDTSPFSSPDFNGTLTSQGYNLIGNTSGTTITGTTTGNILNISANLGALQNNGGSTQTMALLANSPAINAGDPNFTPPPNTDQRGTGFDRVIGSRIDIGAFESNFAPEIVVRNNSTEIAESTESIDFGSTSLGNPITQALTINNTGNGVLTLSDLVLPAAFELLGTFPGTVAAGSSATFNVRLNANSIGDFIGDLTFNNNDADENPFVVALTGTVA